MNYRWCCVEADHGTAISHQALMHLHTHTHTRLDVRAREQRTGNGELSRGSERWCALQISRTRNENEYTVSRVRVDWMPKGIICSVFIHVAQQHEQISWFAHTLMENDWHRKECIRNFLARPVWPTEAITFLLFGIRHIFLCLLHFITCVFGSQPSIGSVTAANLRFEGNSNLCLYAAYNKWMRRLLVFFSLLLLLLRCY